MLKHIETTGTPFDDSRVHTRTSEGWTGRSGFVYNYLLLKNYKNYYVRFENLLSLI